MRHSPMNKGLFFISLGAFAVTLFFYFQTYLPLQQREWEVQQRPVGHRSDLYPAWLAAREFLMHGKNPYSSEITEQIQVRAYGRKLQPGNPHDWRDEQRFAYPLYTTIIIAPFAMMPFQSIQLMMWPGMIASIAFASWCWLLTVKLAPRVWIVGSVTFLTFANWQGIEALYLQQPTLLVAALIAAAVASYRSRRFGLSGTLVAMAMVKPQLSVPLFAWLFLLSCSTWSERKRFVFCYATVMAILLIASEIMLPGWFTDWRDNLSAYADYVGGNAFLLTLVMGRLPGTVVSVLLILTGAYMIWKDRRADPSSSQFNATLALVVSSTVALPPIWHYYDEVLLVPVILVGSQALRTSAMETERRLIILAALVVASASLMCPPIISILYSLRVFPENLTLLVPLFPVVFTPVAALAIAYSVRGQQLLAHRTECRVG
jgi:hypothetical protein